MTVYEVGDTAALSIIVTPADGTTAAVVTVIRPDGSSATPTVTGGSLVGGTKPFTAGIPVTIAGEWVQRWVVTGTGANVESTAFTVNASLVPAYPITLNLGTDVGKVRLVISDTDRTAPVFTDAELLAFIGMEGSNLRRAAALALDTIASNEAMVSKVITTQDLQTDGAKVADALRKHAESLRASAPGGSTASGVAVGIRTTGYDPLGLTANRQSWQGNAGDDYDYLDPNVTHLGLP